MGKFSITTPIEQTCPYCGFVFEMASGETKPKAGAVCVCIRCYSISVFDENLNIRKATPEEFLEIRESETWIDIQRLRAVLKATEHMTDD